jgi:RPA family protein
MNIQSIITKHDISVPEAKKITKIGEKYRRYHILDTYKKTKKRIVKKGDLLYVVI